jgi:hypothetical protein
VYTLIYQSINDRMNDHPVRSKAVTIKTVNLDDDLIAAAEQRARALAEEYGVPVSFSEIVRRALASFLLPIRSTDRSKGEQTTEAADIAA